MARTRQLPAGLSDTLAIMLLAFSITLMVAVLVSGAAHRSIVSTAVLFLGVGGILGLEPIPALDIAPDDQEVKLLAELALFSVLFTDGMRVGLRDLISAWHLPGRALLLGLPLSLLLTAAAAHWMLGTTWMIALLVGAILSPTDPVFAAAIVGREVVPGRLRHLLNVESGINDGLALPVVITLLAVVGPEAFHPVRMTGEVAGGVALGVALPWLAIRLEQSRFFQAAPIYEPINAFAIGLLLLAITFSLHLNEFLAAFAGGVCTATVGPAVKDAFHKFGEIIAELLKLAALMLFGALISLEYLTDTTWWEVAFVATTLFLVRSVALSIALLGSRLSWRERAVAAWFGPKGFASVVYGLLVLNSGLEDGPRIFHWVALVVGTSIVAHSSTDVLIAGYFRRREAAKDDRPAAA